MSAHQSLKIELENANQEAAGRGPPAHRGTESGLWV